MSSSLETKNSLRRLYLMREKVYWPNSISRSSILQLQIGHAWRYIVMQQKRLFWSTSLAVYPWLTPSTGSMGQHNIAQIHYISEVGSPPLVYRLCLRKLSNSPFRLILWKKNLPFRPSLVFFFYYSLYFLDHICKAMFLCLSVI